MGAPTLITRYGPPSKMDMAPTLSVCKVVSSSSETQFYVQLSSDDEDPKWEKLDDIYGSTQITDAVKELLG